MRGSNLNCNYKIVFSSHWCLGYLLTALLHLTAACLSLDSYLTDWYFQWDVAVCIFAAGCVQCYPITNGKLGLLKLFAGALWWLHRETFPVLITQPYSHLPLLKDAQRDSTVTIRALGTKIQSQTSKNQFVGFDSLYSKLRGHRKALCLNSLVRGIDLFKAQTWPGATNRYCLPATRIQSFYII